VLARSHVVIALAAWTAAWWRPPAIAIPALPGPIPPLSLAAPLLPPEALPGMDVTGRAAATLMLVALGAVLPDLDHPQAWLAQLRLARRGWLHAVRPFLLPSLVIHYELGHRGALHSLLPLAVLMAGTRASGSTVPGLAGAGGALAWGYALHLLADLVTRQGVPLLLPFWRGRLRLPRPLAIHTGGLGEALHVLAIVLLAAAYSAGLLLPSGE
jgi:membrane-bound metal-dependent hydrolase YbcI (DUF457 family)